MVGDQLAPLGGLAPAGVDHGAARHHLRDHQRSAEAPGNPPEGLVGDARQRRQHDPASQRDIADAFGVSEVVAAHLCATTPARQLGLKDRGWLGAGQRADVVVLDHRLMVAATFV